MFGPDIGAHTHTYTSEVLGYSKETSVQHQFSWEVLWIKHDCTCLQIYFCSKNFQEISGVLLQFVSNVLPKPHVVMRAGFPEAAESRICDWFIVSCWDWRCKCYTSPRAGSLRTIGGTERSLLFALLPFISFGIFCCHESCFLPHYPSLETAD